MSPPLSSSALDDPPLPASPLPGEGPRRRRRSWRQRAVLTTGVVVVLALVAAAAAVGYGIWRFSQLHKEKLSLTKAAAGGPENYLVVGSDSRTVIDKSDPDYKVFKGGADATGGQRSDTIMVVRIDPGKHTAKMLSFPRDLWVPIYGTSGSQRINTAYNNGPQPLIDTIEQDFGIPINHYVEVNFQSFRDVVNAIGGVPIYFSTAMRDNNSGLNIQTPGCVLLNGDQALSFARSRHLYYRNSRGYWVSDPTADLGRITRQQIFIRKVIARAEAKATGLNLIATDQLVRSVVKNLKVDSSFTIGDMFSLMGSYKAFDSKQLSTYTLPVTPFVTAGGADVLHLQVAESQPILDRFRSQHATSSEKPSEVTLSVSNGGGVTGEAGRTASNLEAAGFTVSGTGNAPVPLAQTTVYYGQGAQSQADLVASYVEGGAQETADSTMAAGEVRLVIGRDFAGITSPSGSSTSSSSGSTGSGSTGSSATGSSAAGTSGSSTVASTTTTTAPIGKEPGVAPKGVNC